jgi:hypothetical protein
MFCRFLLLNSCGGFVESLVVDRLVPWDVKRHVPALGRKMLGFAWAYLFFCCTVPSYQWAEYHKLALKRGSGFLIWFPCVVVDASRTNVLVATPSC